MNNIIYLCLAVALAIPVAGQSKTSKGDSNADLRDRIHKVFEAWTAMDPKRASEYYAKDPNLVFYDIAPTKYTGWSDYEKGVVGVLAQHEYIKLSPGDDLAIHRQGNLAWTTSTLNTDVKLKNGPRMTDPIRWTAIWEKRGSKWLMVHEHVSMIPH
jgi:ketosteroid isomerase-like protein